MVLQQINVSKRSFNPKKMKHKHLECDALIKIIASLYKNQQVRFISFYNNDQVIGRR